MNYLKKYLENVKHELSLPCEERLLFVELMLRVQGFLISLFQHLTMKYLVCFVLNQSIFWIPPLIGRNTSSSFFLKIYINAHNFWWSIALLKVRRWIRSLTQRRNLPYSATWSRPRPLLISNPDPNLLAECIRAALPHVPNMQIFAVSGNF